MKLQALTRAVDLQKTQIAKALKEKDKSIYSKTGSEAQSLSWNEVKAP